VPRVTWARRARLDLVELRQRYKSAKRAKAMATRLIEIARHLEQHPELGRVGVVPGTRELVVGGSRYVLVYTVADDGDDVVVLAVVDTRRNWR
jgi:toxin ParE1/3/4